MKKILFLLLLSSCCFAQTIGGGGGGGGAPTGAAGGVLSGTYPNPGLGGATAHTLSVPLACIAASSSGTAYTCTTSPTYTPVDGDIVQFEADVANTGSATLNVNASSAATIKKNGGGANLIANDLLAGQNVLFVFDGTNWQMQAPTGNAGAGVSFPLLAPNGTIGAPSYSFSTDTGAGMYLSSNNVNFVSDHTATGMTFTQNFPDDTLEFQMGCTYSSLGCGMAVIPSGINPSGTVHRWHELTYNPTGTWSDMLQFQGEASGGPVAMVIGKSTDGAALFIPCTGNSCSGAAPLEIGDESVKQTDYTQVGHFKNNVVYGQITAGDSFRILNKNPASNKGEIFLNDFISIDNSSNNSGNGALDIQVPAAGGANSGIVRIFTNDGVPASTATGTIEMVPNDGGSRPRIQLYNANGGIFEGRNKSGTVFGQLSLFSGDTNIQNQAGTVTLSAANVANWRVSTAGHLTAVTDNSFDIGQSGATRPRNIWIAGTSSIAGLATFGAGELLTETSAPTNASSSGVLWEDSTTHEFGGRTNGSSSSGMMVRSLPGQIHQTAQTAAITTATLCAANNGACNVAGEYHVHFTFIETGTACGTPGTGGVTFLLTWTDTNTTVHSAVSLGMDDASAINAVSQTFHFQTSLAAAWASGDFNISTNGAIIQYATGYTACGVGTGTYQLDIAVTRLQ